MLVSLALGVRIYAKALLFRKIKLDDCEFSGGFGHLELVNLFKDIYMIGWVRLQDRE